MSVTPLVAQTVKHLPTMRETWVRSLGWEDPLEKEMAIHSRTFAWKIPWMEEPGRLQSMGSQRDWVTSLLLSLSLLFNLFTGWQSPYFAKCLLNFLCLTLLILIVHFFSFFLFCSLRVIYAFWIQAFIPLCVLLNLMLYDLQVYSVNEFFWLIHFYFNETEVINLFALCQNFTFCSRIFFAYSMDTKIFSYGIVSMFYCFAILVWIYNPPGIDFSIQCSI